MIKTVLLFFVFTLFSCAPQNKETKEKKSIEPQQLSGTTNIEFDEEIYDFGSLISGEIVIATFKFTNTGDHNLVIKKIESDCGCVTAKFSKTAVKPGNSGIIELEFDSSGMFGNQFKSIEINANTKELKHLAIFASVKNKDLEIKY